MSETGTPGFANLDEFERVLVGFLQHYAKEDPGTGMPGSGLIIVFRVTDLGVDVVTDTTVAPQPGAAYEVYMVKRFARTATCVYEVNSTDLDRLYRGTLPASIALVSGAIRPVGTHFESYANTTRKALEMAIPLYQKWRENHRRRAGG